MSEHSRPNDERNNGGGGEPSIVEGAAEAECAPTSPSGIVRDQQRASAENGAGVQTVRQFFSDGRRQTVECRSTNSASEIVDGSGTGERGDSTASVGRDDDGGDGGDAAGTTPEVWRHTQSADSIFYAPLEGRSSGAIDGASGLGPRESSAPSLSLVQPSLQCHISGGSASGPPPRDDEAAIVFEDPRTGSKGNEESKEAPENLASACSVPADQSSSEASFSSGRESGGGDVADEASSGPEIPSAEECQYRGPFAGEEEDEYDDDESMAGPPPRDDEAAIVFQDPRSGGKETTSPLERARLRKWRFREKIKSMPDVFRNTPARVEMASAPSSTQLGRAAFTRNSESHDEAVANSGTPLRTTNIGRSRQHTGESNEERPGAHDVTSHGSDGSSSNMARSSVSVMSGGNSSDTSLGQTEMAGLPIEAVAVNIDEEIDMLEQRRSQMRDALRSEIIEGAPRAEVIGKEGSGCSPKSMNNCRISKRVALATGLIFLVSIVIGVSLGFSGRGSDAVGNASGAGVPSSTFASVLESRVLRCGMRSADIAAGFVTINEDGELVGFYVDLCRAVAAAMFGSSDLIELIRLSNSDRFAVLAAGGVDVLVRGDTYTFERDVHESNTGVGFSFSTPVFYDGLSFAGIPQYVSCAENLDTTGSCSDLKVCVKSSTTWFDIVSRILPRARVVEINTDEEYFEGLGSEDCNVVAGEISVISIATARGHGYTGEYVLGSTLFSKEPLALVTRDGDAMWSDFVNSVVQALLVAEERNITQSTADSFPDTSFFGDRHKSMFRNAIAAVGNYGEIYARHLEWAIPRQPINMLNTGDSGLIFAHPFGKNLVDGPGPVDGGVIERILAREQLVCGVSAESPLGRFEAVGNMRIGMDAGFCRAVAAALFEGASENVIIKEFTLENDGFNALIDGDIDVWSGTGITFGTNLTERSKEHGFSYSQPYFFNPADVKGRSEMHALVTLESDPQFTAFVYWVVAAFFYAEGEEITQKNAHEMPRVNLFGLKFTRMFRDAILAMGNYGEIYDQSKENIEAMPPRGGRNMLNNDPYEPQHNPAFFPNIITPNL